MSASLTTTVIPGTAVAALQSVTVLKVGDPGISKKLKLKKGAKLPPLLEARRLEFAIPDCCFTRNAAFGRVLIYQVNDPEDEMAAPGSMLYAPQATQDRNKTAAPRGVVVTAGLKARDYLWANGADIGSIVNFVRLSPWRMPVGRAASKDITMHVVRVGDIVAFEDNAWEHKVVLDEANALHQLRIDGKVRPRADLQSQDEDDSY